MATDSEMGAPEGLLSVFFIAGLLLGTCLSEQACVGDACFDQSIHQLKIERSKTDPTSGLKYKERSTDLVATIDVIGVCLPGVNPNVLADTFASCSNVKVKEEVCTVAKRGWLEEKEGKSVVNENALLATFKDLDGGEDAVRECLQIPEVYEYDEYYYYDYANYFDEYDYERLEESASGSRKRRAATGKGTKKQGKEKAKEAKKNAGKRKKAKGRKNNRKNRNGKAKNASKKEAKAARKATKKRARKAENRAEQKKAQKAQKEERKKKKADRKAEKEVNKESLNAEKEARKKALSKLGLKKMPSKSTLEKLSCVQEKITELLVRCAKSILSKTN